MNTEAARKVAPEPDIAGRILIVDDIADNRTILRRRLERRNFAVIEAENGRQALEHIARKECDIVLLDVMMPEMDGIEVLQAIRNQYGEQSLPVIMVTAKSQTEDIVAALEYGANDYVTKPVDFPVALARINTQLSRKIAEDRSAAIRDELQRLNNDLDERIRQRTSRLEAINEKLQKEIERREASEVKSHYLAYHDALTGLANRVLFRDILDRYLREFNDSATPSAILFIDLDGFKNINDTLGHSAGDELLKQIAELLRREAGEHDCVARLGGDEFAILQVGKRQPEGASTLANRLIDEISKPFASGTHEMCVGASIGVVIDEACSSDSESLLKAADLAMYRAKGSGRGTYRVFDPEMEAEVVARQTLEQELRVALRRGEFRLNYQPLIDLKSGRIVSFEALMRWEHPVHGEISPAGFIKVAEEIGLISQLGDWALREACREASRWPDQIRVAVNLSPIQFVRGSLVSTVIGALAASGLDPARLELEITESVMLEKSERNVSLLNQLRELGVKISMDDFGTGYSSLSYLRNFRFDKIKIDQSFIRNVNQEPGDLAIVRSIIALGTSFGIRTTGEGVENEEQAQCLLHEGCTEVQGRLYSMPVPQEKLADLFAKYGNH
ncbi:MAG: putative bifunctional diguanylate cyclase/phosphodiesterase [Beijerinckiaceae bacterium]